MKLKTYQPCDILKPFVRSIAMQETSEENTYNVLPDTGLVIGFQYKGRLSRLEDGQENALKISGVSGLTDHYRTFKNSADIGTVLVFFKPAGAAQFFNQPLHELFRESVSLDNFMLRSVLLSLEAQIAEAKTDKQRIAFVEQFLVNQMTHTDSDKLVLAALSLIHQSKGNIRISELTEQLHISQSPLEKRFRQAVGASPKKFASILRLKNLVDQYNIANSFTELGYETGFYDQAHFIKEFKSFTGKTPKEYFRDRK
jgi:AraC-like DNA-binding protein